MSIFINLLVLQGAAVGGAEVGRLNGTGMTAAKRCAGRQAGMSRHAHLLLLLKCLGAWLRWCALQKVDGRQVAS